MKILICEDNPIIAMDLGMAIERMGHEATGYVTRSDRCLDRCREDPPELVLVDIDLADGATGPSLTKNLTELKILSVIVSGQTDSLRPSDHDALAVVEKPFAYKELEDVLERARGMRA